MAGEPVRLRFLASGRADQTPVAVELEGVWLPVRLLSEELRQGPAPASPRLRRFRLEAPGGRVLVVEGGEGDWRLA